MRRLAIARSALAAAATALALAAPAVRAQDGGASASPLVGWADSAKGLEASAPLHTTLVHPPYGHTLGIHRARPRHLEIFLGGRTAFDDPQGMAAVKFASDDDPDAKGDDFQLTLFGVNSGRGEVIYNSSMKTLGLYVGEGGGDGNFSSPHGITATADGRVYVADTGNRRVARLRWDPVGRALRWVGSWPAGRPFDVAADARGNAWIVDREADAVLRFADSAAGAGTALLPPSPIEAGRWPLPEDATAPLGIAVGDSLDPWYRPRAYRLHLVDRNGERLRVLDAEGRVRAEVSAGGLAREGVAAGRFLYLALDHYGNVYATDPVAEAVHKFDPALGHLATFTGPGSEEWALRQPRGIAIWKRFGQVFVAEREGARYFFVGTDFAVADPVAIRMERGSERYALDLFLTEAATVRLAFLDAAGDTLSVADAGGWPAGDVTVRWGEGEWRPIPPPRGWRERVERVAVVARPTYSSRKKFRRVRTVDVEWRRP